MAKIITIDDIDDLKNHIDQPNKNELREKLNAIQEHMLDAKKILIKFAAVQPENADYNSICQMNTKLAIMTTRYQ